MRRVRQHRDAPAATAWGVEGEDLEAGLERLQWRLPKELHPRALQGAFDAQNGREKKVNFPGLDFLQCAQMQISQFGELFLREVSCGPLAAHVSAEAPNVFPVFARQGHASLRRKLHLTGAAYRA